MAGCLADAGVAVLGGDERQIILAEALAKQAAWVRVYGLAGVSPAGSLFPVNSMLEAIKDAQVVVLPISGANEEGLVRSNISGLKIKIDRNFFTQLKTPSLLVTGSFPRELKAAAEVRGIKVLEYAERDEVAVPNAVPTAEGAIQLAMEHTPYTIDGSTCLVLGYGRVARALVKRLLPLGARVIVAARNPRQLAEAQAAGCSTVPLSLLAREAGRVDIIFNTIPAPVLTAGVLEKMDNRVLIIDLASAPWGTDFAAAKKRGILAFPAPGLPGKVAPHTAGKILASKLPGLIEEELRRL